jgi:hypothetical protein
VAQIVNDLPRRTCLQPRAGLQQRTVWGDPVRHILIAGAWVSLYRSVTHDRFALT